MKYIDTAEQLARVCQAVAASPWTAVDTEADSLHHYQEKLCLLQVSIPDEDFVIDPLVSVDLEPLVRILSEKPLILHGADFDIRILKRFYGLVPREVFDTMIAAQLLGYEKQGLADLARIHCNVALSKSSQKADWSKRPLDEKLLAYAANDTHYLRHISLQMREELISKGRLEWQVQNCAKLIKALSRDDERKSERENAWQIKGSKLLSGRALSILKQIWSWREEEAKRRDRPSFKILHSETLIEIADWAQKHADADVAHLPNAPRNVKGDLRETLNRLIQEAQSLPEARFIQEKRSFEGKRMDAGGKNRFLLLREEREKITTELKIQPSLLATNATLEILAGEHPKNLKALSDLDCLLPWQLEIAGERFIQATKA